jgi:hypothetical protein
MMSLIGKRKVRIRLEDGKGPDVPTPNGLSPLLSFYCLRWNTAVMKPYVTTTMEDLVYAASDEDSTMSGGGARYEAESAGNLQPLGG